MCSTYRVVGCGACAKTICSVFCNQCEMQILIYILDFNVFIVSIFSFFLFGRLDNTLEEIIFKLVPGLRERKLLLNSCRFFVL